MKKRFILSSIIILFIIFSCTRISEEAEEVPSYPIDSVYQKYITSLQESMVFDEAEDTNDRILAIRQNFRRINSLTEWDSIIVKGVTFTLESGYVNFYYANSRLEKALVRYYGESWQQIKEYYFLDKKLSFTFEKYYHYNAPVYLDSATAAKEGSDLFFDGDSSKIDLTKTYLINGEIIKIVSKENDATSFKAVSKNESQKKLNEELAQVLLWEKSNERNFEN